MALIELQEDKEKYRKNLTRLTETLIREERKRRQTGDWEWSYRQAIDAAFTQGYWYAKLEGKSQQEVERIVNG